MTFFKDDPALAGGGVMPAHPIAAPPSPATVLGQLARSYNEVGGLIDRLAGLTGIDPMAVLAVWYVESGGRPFVAGRPVLRFEVHKFWRYWGVNHAAVFDAHLRFGGHGTSGKSHENHLFRNPADSDWRPFHGKQVLEYEVFDFASGVATRDLACMSASFGGPQIMGFNHAACGYASANDLFDAFAADPRWQVLGFFDFCRMKGLIPEIRDHLWLEFAAQYNGDAAAYGPKLAGTFGERGAFNALPRA